MNSDGDQGRSGPSTWPGVIPRLLITILLLVLLLFLAGIVLNDAIVLIEFVEMKIEERLKGGVGLAGPGERSCAGLSRAAFHGAVAEGARLRIVPILLTTLTTVGGLLPLAIAGGPLFEPLAVVVIFGLLLATVLTLFVLPAVFAIFVETFRVRLFHEPLEDETKGT